MRRPESGLPSYVSIGMTTASASKRKRFHEDPVQYTKDPTGKLCQLKHQNDAYPSTFVPLLRVPIAKKFDAEPDEIGRWIFLDRIGETFSTL
jgi:hypothetical protein